MHTPSYLSDTKWNVPLVLILMHENHEVLENEIYMIISVLLSKRYLNRFTAQNLPKIETSVHILTFSHLEK